MAFGWWKTKRSAEPNLYVKLLAMEDLQYAQFVADFVDQMDGGTRSHVAVAYQNLLPMVSAFHTHNKQHGGSYFIEDLITDTAAKLESTQDEINSRRYSWFLFAALVARLEKLARTNDEIVPIGAAIWSIIATEYPRLKHTLPHNVVWSDAEKEWFDLCETDERLMSLAINNHIPLAFAQHDIIADFARRTGVPHWPSTHRIVFVP
jgi:hypothetical protein